MWGTTRAVIVWLLRSTDSQSSVWDTQGVFSWVLYGSEKNSCEYLTTQVVCCVVVSRSLDSGIVQSCLSMAPRALVSDVLIVRSHGRSSFGC
jgi:hypothetical protein